MTQRITKAVRELSRALARRSDPARDVRYSIVVDEVSFHELLREQQLRQCESVEFRLGTSFGTVIGSVIASDGLGDDE